MKEHTFVTSSVAQRTMQMEKDRQIDLHVKRNLFSVSEPDSMFTGHETVRAQSIVVFAGLRQRRRRQGGGGTFFTGP